MRSWLESALVCSLFAVACGRGAGTDPLVACGPGGSCPTGLICASDNTCWKPPAPLAPEKPGNVKAVRGTDGVTVSWSPGARATSYRVARSTTRTGQIVVFAPTTDTAFLDRDVQRSDSYAYSVTAISSAGETQSDFALVGPAPVPPPPPFSFVATGGIRAVHLNWSFSPGDVAIFRATVAGGPYAQIATVKITAPPSYDDTGLADGTRYFYVAKSLASDGFPGDPSQEVSALTAPSAPTGVRAAFASFSNELTISWDPVPGAAGYCVKLVNSFPCGFPTTTATTFVQSISPGFAIDVRVSAVVAAGLAFLEGPESIPIHLVSPPVAPFGIIVVPAGPFGLKVSWQAVPGAASYAIFRGNAGKFDQVGTSTDAFFVDAGPLDPWTGYQYEVASLNATGAGGAPSFPNFGQTTGLPDQENLGSSGTLASTIVDLARDAGQTVTVGQSGILAAVEVSANSTAGTLAAMDVFNGPQLLASATINLFSTTACCAPLLDGPPTASLFPFVGLGIPVSAGQTLRLRIRDLFSNQGQLARSADGYAGGTFFRAGGADPTSDLVFKTFIKPAPPAFFGPSLPFVFPGVGRVALAWIGSSRAAGYTVLRSPAIDGPYTPISTLQPQANFVDAPLARGTTFFYQVHAVDAAGNVAATSAVEAGPLDSDVDQSNPGDGSGFALVDGQHLFSAAQSFTVGKAGILAGVQFSAVAADGGFSGPASANVSIRDETGTALIQRQVTLQLEGCCGPPALDPSSPALQTVDLSPFHFAVTPGQILRFQVDSPSPLQLSDGPDLYAAGNEFVNGVAIPARDLAFQVLVQ